LAVTLEFDCFDGETYTSTADEVTVVLNGVEVTGVPSLYESQLGTPELACPAGMTCSAPGFGSLWRHIGPIDISALVNPSTNTLTFTELATHGSGLANILIKNGSTVIYGPAQPPGLVDISSYVGPDGTPGTCPTVNSPCYNFNGPATVIFTLPGIDVPVPSFTASPSSPTEGNPVSFIGSATGGTAPYTFVWNFGDGGSATGATASHTFSSPGTFSVTLTATDATGSSNTVTMGVTVLAAFTLTVNSTPSAVPFTLNAQAAQTPFAQALPSGTYTIVMPTSVVIAGATYNFLNWSDGNLSPTRVVSLSGNTSLQALYAGATLMNNLTVNTVPSGVTFMLNGQSQITPFAQSLPQANYTISVPASVTVGGTVYNFQSWQDGTTATSIIVSLLVDTTVTATYTAVSTNPTLAITSNPSGVSFTLGTVSETTPFTQSLAAGSYTITMPATITLAGVAYTFQSWSDGTTSPIKNISLTANLTLSATYTSASGPPPTTSLLEIVAVAGGVAVIAGIGVYAVTRKGKGKARSARPRSTGPR
jgi:PKD repeat protein